MQIFNSNDFWGHFLRSQDYSLVCKKKKMQVICLLENSLTKTFVFSSPFSYTGLVKPF